VDEWHKSAVPQVSLVLIKTARLGQGRAGGGREGERPFSGERASREEEDEAERAGEGEAESRDRIPKVDGQLA